MTAIGTGHSCISSSDWIKMIGKSTGIPQAVASAVNSCKEIAGSLAAGCVAVGDICTEWGTGGPVTNPNTTDSLGMAQGRRCVQERPLNPFISRCERCQSCCSQLPASETGDCHAVCNAQHTCGLPVSY